MTGRARPGKRRVLETTVVILALAGSGGLCSEKPQEWKLVWSDDFDGPDGRSPDSNRWRFDIGTDWGNAQLEYDTSRPENVSLDGTGNLAITAREESYRGQPYTSGRINTRGHFAQEEGRFEARIRLPTGRGIWPAFWLLGGNFEDVGWPGCGEIDIMEHLGHQPTILHGSLHGPGYSGGEAVTRRFDSGEPLANDFHVFALEWDGDRISWMVDDVRYQSVSPRDLPAGGRWVFDHPFFLVLNVAVGGNWPGPPDSTTTFPQTMLVDYVRVYSAEP